MTTTFHHRLMTALDASQMDGAHLVPLHNAIRRALRESNMAGKAIASAEELGERIGRFAPWLRAEALAFAA